MDTEVAKYPKMTFWKKFVEIHKLMWSKPRAYEQEPNKSTASASPSSWPLALSKSIVTAWRKGNEDMESMQQISMIANPIVWWTGFLGVATFVAAHTLFLIRTKRGYVEQRGLLRDLKEHHLPAANIFFIGWAFHYLPYLFLSQTAHHLTVHHYFPALYCSVLLSCTVFSGLARSLMVQQTRQYLWIALSVVAIAVFVQLSPLTYGTTTITSRRYQALERWLYINPNQRPSHLVVVEYEKTMNLTSSSESSESSESSSTSSWSSLFLPQGSYHPSQKSEITFGWPRDPPTSEPSPTPSSSPVFLSQEGVQRPTQPTALENKEINKRTSSSFSSESSSSSTPSWSYLLFSQEIQLAKSKPRARPPVLETHYPFKDTALPMENLFMTPSQRPPQLWELNEQQGRPNAYQRQQLRAVFEVIEKEEHKKRLKMEKKRQGQEEKERKE
ncbi:hypothetical protein EDD21DRAFT_420667, partial [Dissophora ornata]